jgi:hypothetical protein
MTDLFGFGAEAVARIWRAVLYVERYLYPRHATDGNPPRRPPRTYRHFTLTEQLDAGGEADVTWDDDTTGTVYDRDTCCYGLEGETGEAGAFLNEAGDAVEWRVTKNPGQPIYEGTAAAAISSSASTANINVSIDGSSRTVSAAVPSGAISSGKKYPSGGRLFISHERGTWKIIVFVTCEVAA